MKRKELTVEEWNEIANRFTVSNNALNVLCLEIMHCVGKTKLKKFKSAMQQLSRARSEITEIVSARHNAQVADQLFNGKGCIYWP